MAGIVTIFMWAFGIFVLYLVIAIAVRDGINRSVVGRLLEKRSGLKKDRDLFFDNDLDDET